MNILTIEQEKKLKTILLTIGGKGGDGKTLVTAHVAEKLERESVGVRAYDFEAGDGTGLSRFYAKAKKSKLGEQADLDELIDAIADSPSEQVTVVDFPANSGDAFLKWVSEIDWADLRDVGIRFVVVLVLSDDGDSFALAERWIQTLGDHVEYVTVFNEGRGKDFGAYRRSIVGMDFAHQYKPLEIRFPEIPQNLMLHIRNEGSTLFRALDEQTKQLTVTGLENKFMVKTRVVRLRKEIDNALQPLVNLISNGK